MDRSIAITGAEGQLGRSLVERLGPLALGWSRRDCDITSPEAIQKCLDQAKHSRASPSVLINSAAYNAVDAAETDREAAWRVNVEGPKLLAEACKVRGIRLVHVSTDYVFGNGAGPGGGWRESDEPKPCSVYAESKRAGELAVLEVGGGKGLSPLVVRTCGLYGAPSTSGKRSFVEAILQRALTGQPLRVVDDQRCTPTHVDDLVEALLCLLNTPAQGLVHVVNSGDCTWFELAQEVLRQTGLTVPITPIPTSELHQKALRPIDSRLSTLLYQSITGQSLPPWKAALADRLRQDGRLNST